MITRSETILIVEDDAQIRNFISYVLQQEGFPHLSAGTAKNALSLLVTNPVDLVLLDLGLPDCDGMDVIKKIREWSEIPIIVVSARDQDHEKAAALDTGADDYLTKPFSINELTARVHSLIRRYTTLNPAFSEETDCICLKDMTIDRGNRSVTVRGALVELTGKEFDLLVFLASNKGRIFTKKQIYTQVWEDEYAFDDSNIMSFISKLRKKIEPNPEQPFYVLTVRGVGYRFNKEA